MCPEYQLIRLQYLSDNISRDLELLKEYEDALRLEEDPRTRAKYRKNIQELGISASRYRVEYDELTQSLPVEAVPQMEEVALVLKRMNARLGQLIVGQQSMHCEMSSIQESILGYYDQSERKTVEHLIARLRDEQLLATQAVLQAISHERLEYSEMQDALATIMQSLNEIRKSRAVTSNQVLAGEMNSIAGVLDAPAFDVRHKLKVSIPIIPFLLSYEGEASIGSGLNLESLWDHLVARARERD